MRIVEAEIAFQLIKTNFKGDKGELTGIIRRIKGILSELSAAMRIVRSAQQSQS